MFTKEDYGLIPCKPRDNCKGRTNVFYDTVV